MDWIRAGTLKNGEAVFWWTEDLTESWAVEKGYERLVEPSKKEMEEIKALFSAWRINE